jgi:cytochrome b6-f complex iron-sulfur subunit
MERRKFIKAGCGYCAGLASVGILGALLEGCKPSDLIYKTETAAGLISVPAEKFIDKKYLIIRVAQLDYDLLLVKENESAYHALAMQCTHRQQSLVVTSTGLNCNEHGSRFDMDGMVLQDPATKPLIKYKADLKENFVVIRLS